MNLASALEQRLPAELAAFIKRAGEVAYSRAERLYLVGGAVRDLLLGEANLDLDLVVEGDATKLALTLAKLTSGEVTSHPQFNTAKIEWDGHSADVTTARTETYARPGALPTVEPSTIEQDLLRRDFTINAMAVSLSPESYGELIDPYGGQEDLKNRLIRVLHEQSLVDDATRIWRAVRYEQRLGFQIEATTLRLLKRDLPFLDTISGDRIRYELECVLEEKQPERALRRAGELGVLSSLSPPLRGNGRLAEGLEMARQMSQPSPALYLALLFYRLNERENERLISVLNLPRDMARVTRDAIRLREKLDSLDQLGLKPSLIYRLLRDHDPIALTASLIASDSQAVRQNIKLFQGKLHYVKSILNGHDLQEMGLAAGPRIREMLARLLDARLDGEATSRADEVAMVKRWLSQ